MNKHIKFIYILFVLSTFLFAGCSQIGSSPEYALSMYLDAFLLGNYEEAYRFISTEDKRTKNLQEYLAEQSNGVLAFAQALSSKTSYEIKEMTLTGNQAKAKIAVTAPNFGAIFIDVMGVAFKYVFGDEENEENMVKMLEEKYRDKELPMTTTIQTLDLVKENNGWKVFLDWEVKETINTTMKEAKQLEEEEKLFEAKEKYQLILELDSNLVEAFRKVEELDKEIISLNEKQEYIPKVKLYALTAKYHTIFSDDKVLGVKFKLKNNGDRNLTKVEVTVYFKDAKGEIIAEEIYNPILVNEYSFLSKSDPLKPNYIKEFEASSYFSSSSVPSEWQEGNAVAKITDIEFE